jgi:hypothetical protein
MSDVVGLEVGLVVLDVSEIPPDAPPKLPEILPIANLGELENARAVLFTPRAHVLAASSDELVEAFTVIPVNCGDPIDKLSGFAELNPINSISALFPVLRSAIILIVVAPIYGKRKIPVLEKGAAPKVKSAVGTATNPPLPES